MSQRTTTPVWPFTILFVFAMTMSVTAPRFWETVAQRTALHRPVALRSAPHNALQSPAVSEFAERVPLVAPAQPVGRPAAAQGRVAAEYVAPPIAPTVVEPIVIETPSLPPTTSSASQVAPPVDVASAVIPSRPSLPTFAAPLDEAPLDEAPPTLDRPRLWGGVRPPVAVAKTVTAPLVAPSITQPITPMPSLAPSPAAPATPALVGPLPVETAAIVGSPVQTIVPRSAAPVAAPTPAAKPAPEPPSWWPAPADLVARLAALGGYPATQVWAEKTAATLQGILKTDGLLAPQAVAGMQELRRAVATSLAIDESRLDPATAVELRLARHALVRRLDVWEALAEVVRHDDPEAIPAADRGARQLEVCLAELDRRTTAAGELGRQWRDYLLLDGLQPVAHCEGPADDRLRLVREALNRLETAGAQSENGTFLHEGPFADLRQSLILLTEFDVDPQRLLVDLERFEQGGLPSHGGDLALACRRLADSHDEAKRKLAAWLDSHYRNANVRITIAPEIVNRMLPDALKRSAPVADTILGKETRGWSTSRTGLNAQFLPGADRIAMRLTAEGMVHAQTRTFSGPVRLFNFSNSAFRAEKDVEWTVEGITVKPATASSRSNTRLRAIESDFDGLPIIGGIVAAIAHNQADEKKPAAQREAASKTSHQVERSLDDDIARHLQQADEKLHHRVLDPLARLELTAEVIDLQSTETRAWARFRLAGDDQPAANTPRPRASVDSLIGIQIHQSAVNNVIDRLELQGRKFNLLQLHDHLTERLSLERKADPAKLPPELELTFATDDPLTISCEDGRLELRMALNELRYGDRAWQNFTVRAPFRPEEVDGVVCLVRDGVVRLSGERLSTTAQISLRTVFAKVFPDDLQVKMWPERMATDPRFADLEIQGLELRDGWIGASVGQVRAPQHAAAPVATHAVLPLPRLLRK